MAHRLIDNEELSARLLDSVAHIIRKHLKTWGKHNEWSIKRGRRVAQGISWSRLIAKLSSGRERDTEHGGWRGITNPWHQMDLRSLLEHDARFVVHAGGKDGKRKDQVIIDLADTNSKETNDG